MDKMMDFLFKQDGWDLRRPELIISVTGGAKTLKLKKKVREKFEEGLVKAATNTSNLLFRKDVTILL
jgi:hypothetical protein